MNKNAIPSGQSPLSDAEKMAIFQKEYAPKAHRIGLVTSLVHTVIFFTPPLYLMIAFGIPVNWTHVFNGAVATWGVSLPFWIIEPISYFMVLGIAGTYISFLAGNISNFRLPVSAVAQEVAQVREGSEEGEIISTIAIVATQVMLTISAFTGAVFVSVIVQMLPQYVVAAFDWLLPSIWAAIVVQFGLRSWKYAVVALAASIVVVLYSPLPSWTQIPILVFFMIFLAVVLYNRGIWHIKPKEYAKPAEEPPKLQPQ